MRVLQYASRSVAAAALLAFAAGCSRDSTAPDAPFDAAGTSSDVSAIDESFDAPALDAYAAAGPQMAVVMGGSISAAIRAMPSAALVRDGKSGALRYAASLAKTYTGGGLRPSLSVAAAGIAEEYLGVTFVYDADTDTYAASELAGAPSNGVRFLLYAVNPVTGTPVEPLVELGYVDFAVTETASSGTVHVIVVSGGVTYLDYAVTAAGGVSSATVTIDGYATNGTDRVNFDLGTSLSGNDADGLTIAVDYTLVLPTRGGFRLEIEGTTTGIFTETTVTNVDLEARGDHGTVTIEGTETNGSGTFDVEVNGDLLAVITVTEGAAPTIVGANGQPLSQAEQDAMWAIWYIFAQGFDFFEDLTDPIT